MLIFFLQTWILLVRTLLYVFGDNEAVINTIIPQWDMFPEPTELLLIGCWIDLICTPRSKSNTLTPRTNSQTYWQREISHVMNGIIFCVCSTSAISVPLTVFKRWRKRHSKIKADDEFGIEMPCKGSERACLDCIWKPGENQIWKSASTSELVNCAANRYGEIRYSCLLIKLLRMEHWRQVVFSSAEIWWNVENTSTVRPVSNKLVIDDDMDSDTAAESNPSLKSRSFLNRVNDRLRKMLDRSPEDAMQEIDKRSMSWWMFVSSTLQASVFMGKNYSDILLSIKNTGKISL